MALYIEDEEFTEGVMNGSQVKCGKLVGALRKQLMNEHLGSHFDVQDCISDKFYKDIWFRTAAKNTKIFDEIFLCIPTDHVKTMEERLDGITYKSPSTLLKMMRHIRILL